MKLTSSLERTDRPGDHKDIAVWGSLHVRTSQRVRLTRRVVVPLASEANPVDGEVRLVRRVVAGAAGAASHHAETGGELVDSFASGSGVSDVAGCGLTFWSVYGERGGQLYI